MGSNNIEMKEPGRIYLCKPCNKKYAQLNGIRLDTVDISKNLKDHHTISFEVDKYVYINGEKFLSNGYEDIHSGMEVYYEGEGGILFKVEEPSLHGDGIAEYKSVNAVSVDSELVNKKVVDLQVHNGVTGSIELIASVNKGKSPLSEDFKWSTFWNEDPELSVIDIILQKAENWSVGHIDDNLKTKEFALDVGDMGIYGLLTTVLCQKLNCVFTFDTVHRKINAYDVNTFGKDTNVYISYRNLINSIDIECNSDEIKNRLVAKGNDSLNIRDVNFNRDYIDDLSFYKHERYMSKEMIEKLNNYEHYKNTNRETFAQLNLKLKKLQAQASDLMYKVPSDGCDVKQWESMGSENLNIALKKYNDELTALRISVDDNPQYDSNGKYRPLTLADGTVDNDTYLLRLKNALNGYGGYGTYFEILNYIIPNIQIALANLSRTDENKMEYIRDFETNWELYGIKELEAKKEIYEASVLDKYAKDWKDMTADEKMEYNDVESEYNIYHSKYVEYKNYLGAEDKKGTLLYQLKLLKDKYAKIETDITTTNKERVELVESTNIKNSRFGFTQEELDVYNTLIREDVYTNENIATNSIMTDEEILRTQEKLYQDTLNKLSETSIPQYEFSVSVDNLLQIEEFKPWVKNFEIGSFIRVELESGQVVKLRLCSMQYNPYELGSSLTIGFTSVITSKGGRSDYNYLIGDPSNSVGGSQSSGSSSNSSEVKMSDVLELIKTLRSSTVFHQDITESVEKNLVESGKVSSVVNDYVKAAYIECDKLKVRQAWIDKLFATDITATGSITSPIIKSPNYEDNDKLPVLDDGSLNPDFSVKDGMKIDARTDMAIYTPQIKIYRDTISTTGLVNSGSINVSSGRGNYIGNFGRDNKILADMSLSIGDKNILGDTVDYTAIPNYEYSYNITYELNGSNQRVYTLNIMYDDYYYKNDYQANGNYDVISVSSIETVDKKGTDELGNDYDYSEEYSYNILNMKKMACTDNKDTKTRTFTWTSDLTFETGERISAEEYTVMVYGHPDFINSSIVCGKNNSVNSSIAFAFGENLIRNGVGLTVGRYNVSRPWNLFEVGCGKSNSTRDNAIEVHNNGNTYINNYLYIKNSKNEVKYRLARVGDNKFLYIATDASIKKLIIGDGNISSTRLLGKFVSLDATAHNGTPLVFNGESLRGDKHGVISFGYGNNRFKNMFLSGDIYANASHITTSDERLKPMRRPIEYSHEIVNGVEWIDYMLSKERSTSDRIHSGVCAQQVEVVLNELGIDRGVLIKMPKVQKPLEECSYDEIEYAIRYEEFIPYIGKVVQDHEKEIERLKQLLIKEDEQEM